MAKRSEIIFSSRSALLQQERFVRIGRRGRAPTRKVYWSADLWPHRDRAYLGAYLLDRYGTDYTVAPEPLSGTLSIPERSLGMHSFLVGGSGYGKTRLAMNLLREELRAGCSAVVMDVKTITIREALAMALEAGVPRENITILWPREHRDGVPGWNPLSGDATSVRNAVRQFVGLVKAGSGDTGSRMWDVLTNAATIVAGQGLSILELLRFLQDPAYMDGLLRAARQTPAWEEFEEAGRYFDLEFSALSKAERNAYVAPVLSRLRALVDIKYLKALLCARRDTLDIPGLWQRQRVLLVDLDAWSLGPDGTRLLAGMLAHTLFNTSMRRSGPVPVVLMLDEMSSQEKFLGDAVRQALNMARSQNLRILAACQSMDQLSDGLRSSLLTSTAFRAFFQLLAEDAYRVARSLTVGKGSEPLRVSITADRMEEDFLAHVVEDAWAKPLDMAPDAWAEFSRLQRQGGDRVKALAEMTAKSQALRVYVRVPVTQTVFALDEYVASLGPEDWFLTGPSPLRLIVRFPKPKIAITQERSEEEQVRMLAGRLQVLPQRQAVIRAPDGEVVEVKIVPIDFPDALPDPGDYLGGQDEAEIRNIEQERNSRITALSASSSPGGKASPSKKEIYRPSATPPVREAADDGSL